MSIEAMVALVLGSNLLTGITAGYFARGKTQAEREKAIAEGRKATMEADQLFDERYRKLIGSMGTRIDELEEANKLLHEMNELLKKELQAIRKEEERMEERLVKISRLLGGIMTVELREQEPYRSILAELGG